MPDHVHAPARVGLKRPAAPPPDPRRTAAGAVLIFAASTHWLAWLLMPNAGSTNDAAHLLNILREHRGWVFLSVVVQLISSIAFVPAVLLITRIHDVTQVRLSRVGATLLLIGAGGMSADAMVYLASNETYRPMLLLQTQGIRFLLPLLLAFFAGAIVLALGLQRAGLISTLPMVILVAAVVAVAVGGIPAAALDAGRYAVVLLFLGLYAVGLSRLGWELMRGPGTTKY